MSGSQFGEQNLINALRQYGNTVEQGSVAAGATATSIPAQGDPGWEANQFTESLYFLEFLPGAVNAGLSRRITGNTDDTLTTVAFPDPPAEDDEFVIRHEPKGATDAMNLAEVAGTAQSPADWTPLLQALGLKADAAETDPSQTVGLVALIKGLLTRANQRNGEVVGVADNEAISGGVTATLGNYNRWTLYITVAGAITITLELSPDGGTTWYTWPDPDSDLVFAGAASQIFEMGYDANRIRLTGSNATLTTAQVRGVF